LYSKKELAPIEDQSMVMFVIQSPPDASMLYNVSQMNPVVESLQEIEGGKKIWQIIQVVGFLLKIIQISKEITYG
jgi:multidrug efflux pump